ncbi:MAG: DJ-1/PfpI family protein [Pseudomonadota bacterium]
MLSRRAFSLSALGGLLAMPRAGSAETQEQSSPSGGHSSSADGHDMSAFPEKWKGNEKIVFLGYPGMTALDLVGPQYMLASLWGAEVKVAAKTLDPLPTDTGLTIVPDVTFDEAAAAPDIICVPGAVSGALDAMEDKETIEFLRDRGQKARYVTSVCTGTLLLGKAGLVDGYEVTSHWFTRPLMTEFGAIPVDRRVVRDRNRITGAGVTAGIDFGLMLVGELRDETYAQSVQLLAEYAPEPPFDAGTEATAPPVVVKMMRDMFVGLPERIKALAAN